MRVFSPEYRQMRENLAAWFADSNQFSDPVYAKPAGFAGREVDSTWEVRAGFIGADFVSCNGLAVVLRKGLAARDGIYRVDVYEPASERALPSPTEWAGRIEYAPESAGFTFSYHPDAIPDKSVSAAQFQATDISLRPGVLHPASHESIVEWKNDYERINVAELRRRMRSSSLSDIIALQIPKRNPHPGGKPDPL